MKWNSHIFGISYPQDLVYFAHNTSDKLVENKNSYKLGGYTLSSAKALVYTYSMVGCKGTLLGDILYLQLISWLPNSRSYDYSLGPIHFQSIHSQAILTPLS